MWTEIRPVWILMRRELKDQLRDWRIILPILVLALGFPFIMNWTVREMLDFTSEYGATIVADRLVPFLFMVVGFFPISVSLVIALESFAGEKERNSIEPLLNTPLLDWQIYLGKLLASTLMPLLGSYLAMLVYLLGLVSRGIPLPPPVIMTQIFLLTTIQAVMMVSGAVVISSQATSVRAANLLSSFIVLPVAFLIQWEALVMFWGNEMTLWWVLVGALVIALLLSRVGVSHFNREKVLGREIDVLKPAWAWQVFWKTFKGNAYSVREWYSVSVFPTLRRLFVPALMVLAISAVGLGIGAYMLKEFPVLLTASKLQEQNLPNFERLRQTLLGNESGMFLLIFWQNLRVLLLSMVLGIFTFGVVGTLPIMGTMAVVGFLGAFLSVNQVALSPILTMILPHGIFEVPAAILATAAVLKIGATLATPARDLTIGEVFLKAIADWAKIMVGLVIPLLVVAAFVEAFITPRLVLMVLGQ